MASAGAVEPLASRLTVTGATVPEASSCRSACTTTGVGSTTTVLVIVTVVLALAAFWFSSLATTLTVYSPACA